MPRPRGRPRTRLDDNLYNHYHQRYLKHREHILRTSKRRRIADAVFAREQRLISRRRAVRVERGLSPVPPAVIRAKTLVRSHKEGRPCLDCGTVFPYYVMDFDHVRGVKRANISTMVSRGRSLVTIGREIAKCDLVCANCHRRRTFLSQNPESV